MAAEGQDTHLELQKISLGPRRVLAAQCCPMTEQVPAWSLQPATKACSAGRPRGDVEAARMPLLLDVVLVIPRVAIPASPGAPAPAAVAPAASASASDAPARTTAAVLSAGVGRGTHKCEVDLDGLVEQLSLVGAVDGSAGLGKGGVLDQRVALLSGAIVLAPGQPGCCANKGAWHTLT